MPDHLPVRLLGVVVRASVASYSTSTLVLARRIHLNARASALCICKQVACMSRDSPRMPTALDAAPPAAAQPSNACRSNFSSLALEEQFSGAPTLGSRPSAAPSEARTAAGTRRASPCVGATAAQQPHQQVALISFSGAPSRAPSSVAADSGPLQSMLSIRTPRRQYATFRDADAPANQHADAARGADVRRAPSMQQSLAATASHMSEMAATRTLSVRTPRAVYGAFEDGNAQGDAQRPPNVKPVVTTEEWITKMLSVHPGAAEVLQAVPPASAALGGKQWPEGQGTLQRKHQRFMPNESMQQTTLLGAFHPEQGV